MPYVGPVAFGKLLAYAESQGYVSACLPPPPVSEQDAFDPAACAGPRLTDAQAASKFLPGHQFAVLANSKVWYRQRSCTQTTGCGAWTTPHASNLEHTGMLRTNGYWFDVGMVPIGPVENEAYQVGYTKLAEQHAWLYQNRRAWNGSNYINFEPMPTDAGGFLRTSITNSCLQFISQSYVGSGTWTEFQYAYLIRF